MAIGAFGQSASRTRAIAAFDDGVVFLLDGKAKRATKSLQRAVELDTTFIPGRRMLGVAYDLNDDYPAALAAYRWVLAREPNFSRLLYYQTGELCLRAGQSRAALEYLQQFKALQQEPIGTFGLMGERERGTEASVLEHELDRRIVAAQLLADSSNYRNASNLHNLGTPINSEDNDYFPFFTNDLSSLLYTHQSADGDEDLMEGSRRKPEKDYRTSRFSSFNTAQPEGMCTLVRDGETIFFTLCHEGKKGGGCDLYSGILIDGKIEEVERLPDYLNSGAWDSQAAISCDGRQLFFASTRPGGIGGSDLYSSTRGPDGHWSEPRNLGAGVNTPDDEEAPFLSNDGETLYFSSMGHEGLGDQDIFFSRYDRSAGRWARAVNIGAPINSANRELGFHLSADGRQGFFASDRPGGMGGLDIYGFTLGETLTGKDVTYVSGYVTDSLTGEPLTEQAVPVGDGAVFTTNYAGRFFVCAAPNQQLPVTASRAGYTNYASSFAIPTWDNQTAYRIDLRLSKPASAPDPPPTFQPTPPEEVTESTRVLFAFERAEVTDRQQEALRKLVARAGVHRIVGVSILGYTDEVGSSDYNVGLSQRRAAAVADFLHGLGIGPELISSDGLGELAGSSGRAENRRVEVVLHLRGGEQK